MQEEDTIKPDLTWSQVFTCFAGIIMPALSITLEATTHVCAEVFFDPIPTPWHLVLVIFVPLAQLQVWRAIRRGDPQRLALAGWLNALTIGISIFYSIVYIPILPYAAITLIFIVGLLPLAPYLSLTAAIVQRRQLRTVAALGPRMGFPVRGVGLLAGLALTVVAIGLIELPASLTQIGLQMASSQSPDTRIKGIRFLRTFGSHDHLLRSCYDRTGNATDLIGYLFSLRSPVTSEQARQIYYRVTGETFDTSSPPQRVGGWLMAQDTRNFDNDQGGETIDGKLAGLSLAGSRLEANAQANEAVGYMEWTLRFANSSQISREARAEVQLPPGGVVSRLTLWVNGEEREAAFAGRNHVQQAYRRIVNQRRDPVLVTTAGRDRILVQCFPVLPGGEMKIRVGITVPLPLENGNEAHLLLPRFVNRNFEIPDHVKHTLSIDSDTPLSTESKELSANHVLSVRAELSDKELSQPETSFTLERQYYTQSWAKNSFESDGFVVQQTLVEHVPDRMQRIVLVVDTSGKMKEFGNDIQRALATLPPEVDLKLVLAEADGVDEGSESQSLTASGIEDSKAKLNYANFAGGANNAPALLKAWDLAAQKPGKNAIVWIHAPQLMELQSVHGLRQRWDRPYGPLLYSIQAIQGSDEIDKNLDGIDEVRPVARMGTLGKDLERLFKQLTAQVNTFKFERTNRKIDCGFNTSEAVETSTHLARLWANDEVNRILAARDESLREAAVTLAVRYQLVTPVSGAVVLENAEQYRAAGLEPVNAGSVPTIPEPEMVALMALVAIVLSFLVYRKYRTRGGCPV